MVNERPAALTNCNPRRGLTLPEKTRLFVTMAQG
jgi:hypothetical protein